MALMPIGDVYDSTLGLHWKQVITEGFTFPVAEGQWKVNGNGILTVAAGAPQAVVDAYANRIQVFPDGWFTTKHKTTGLGQYYPSKVLSVSADQLHIRMHSEVLAGTQVALASTVKMMRPDGNYRQLWGRVQYQAQVVSNVTAPARSGFVYLHEAIDSRDGNWPKYGEIGAPETEAVGGIAGFWHFANPAGGQRTIAAKPGFVTTDKHIYTWDWFPDPVSGLPRFMFYVDSTLYYDSTDQAPYTELEILFQCEPDNPLPSSITNVADLVVDWYTVYDLDLTSVMYKIIGANVAGTGVSTPEQLRLLQASVTGTAATPPLTRPKFGLSTFTQTGETRDHRFNLEEAIVATGFHYDLLRYSEPFDSGWPAADQIARQAGGQSIFVSWTGTMTSGTQINWADIPIHGPASSPGLYDTLIDDLCTKLKTVAGTVYLNFMREPDAEIATPETSGGTGGVHGKESQFVAAWRYIYNRFQTNGVTNTKFVMVYSGSADPTKQTISVNLYPGDAYVDYIAWDAFNADPVFFKSFDQTVRPFYTWIKNNLSASKPLMLAEVGSVESSTDASAKGVWFGQMENSLKSGTLPDLVAVVYSDHNTNATSPGDTGTANFGNDSSNAARAAWNHALLATYATNAVQLRILAVAVTGTTGGATQEQWRIMSAKASGFVTGSNQWQVISAVASGTVTVPHANPEFYIWDAASSTWKVEDSLYVWQNSAWKQIA